ncbi:transposase [Algoriphagus aquimarinus]|uniref:Transposase n=1 Tax=Algoriphagus aquimarinus TaxID=237018 RepID=A0A5C7AA16_9BACT|nr:transposase [Algoriphagus aquimarinus]TXE01388.1 transposase [Algoriphagus aquimarinus]
MDIVIKLNNKVKSAVRMIAFPASEEVAESRRRKARKELKMTPSADYLELQGWFIYLTTIGKETAEPKKIFALYKLRWRIEIIFKSWKSNMAFDRVHNVSKIQLWVILWSRFIMIIICTQLIYTPCRLVIKANLNKDLSLLKVTHYLIKHPEKITGILTELQSDPNKLGVISTTMAKYCSYEKRKKRSNYQEDLRTIYS